MLTNDRVIDQGTLHTGYASANAVFQLKNFSRLDANKGMSGTIGQVKNFSISLKLEYPLKKRKNICDFILRNNKNFPLVILVTLVREL